MLGVAGSSDELLKMRSRGPPQGQDTGDGGGQEGEARGSQKIKGGGWTGKVDVWLVGRQSDRRGIFHP